MSPLAQFRRILTMYVVVFNVMCGVNAGFFEVSSLYLTVKRTVGNCTPGYTISFPLLLVRLGSTVR